MIKLIYLFELEGIKINLEDNIPELNNLPFFCEGKVINFFNNNKLEEYILFSTPFHSKLLSEIKQIFIGGKFKSTPKNFYQRLNIIISLKDINTFYLIIHALMSSKSYYLYKNLFLKIKHLLNDLNIKVNFKKVSFISDFEYGLRKTLYEVFKDSDIYGD